MTVLAEAGMIKTANSGVHPTGWLGSIASAAGGNVRMGEAGAA